MNTLEQLTTQFTKFPGIGARQARRFVDFLVRKNSSYTTELARLIQNVKNNMKVCPVSFQYFYAEDMSETRAPIERDGTRDRTTLMIVEKDIDIETIEKSGAYRGVYFVLGGLVPAVASKYQQNVNDEALLAQIPERVAKDDLAEIIFGLSLNPESEHTRVVLEQKIKPFQEKFHFKISRLGRGLSTGTELEYSDADTLENALKTRVS